jgi:hypothetical protein
MPTTNFLWMAAALSALGLGWGGGLGRWGGHAPEVDGSGLVGVEQAEEVPRVGRVFGQPERVGELGVGDEAVPVSVDVAEAPQQLLRTAHAAHAAHARHTRMTHAHTHATSNGQVVDNGAALRDVKACGGPP